MIIRPATGEDLEAIARIQHASPQASQWEPAEYLKYTCLVADQEGVQGYIVARETAPGEYEVLNLAVALECRRGGIGRALLEHVLGAFPGDWFLEVRESNSGAIQLYESTGFRASGKRQNYYATTPEAAIVMVRQK